ncbi:MAG: DEAD/DEAH box helicase family protein, partial [Bacteroidales bacterium]|nr:DEAD/DEAH box helicase family protein [Bacteroidales bacterium]
VKYTTDGTLDIVTGYFTIGALAYLSEQVNDKVSQFRMVLGNIANVDSANFRPLDLLNENITIDAALKLSQWAKTAVEFLKQDKVVAKTLEPNFCHAKLYLYRDVFSEPQKNYYLSGSSNLTEAGIGLKQTNNVELNIADYGASSQYNELTEWFTSIWNKPQAHFDKTIDLGNGKTKKVPFKEYLISEITKIFVEYSPKDLYFKILFELFGSQLETDDPEFNRQIGRLENSAIYNALYDFQKKGALSLIRMLQNYNGAILADAVGLGKTWTALAVIKFYQLQGRETILLCPKKLEQNWWQYLTNQDSKFEKDDFKYFVRFHTDMNEDRLETYNDRNDKFFTNDKPKLLVIDESHNLRNDKSQRYKFLMEKILQKNEDLKVLLLSATPINNSLIDVRNQFKMLVKGELEGYKEKLEIGNLDYTFRKAQETFNEWTKEQTPLISNFITKIPANFFKLTDTLVMARTRKMIIESQTTDLYFPEKEKPENYFITPKQLGNFDSFDDLLKGFPPMLSGYQPAYYVAEKEKKGAIYDEKQRDRFLVKMIYILMAKRLESSWSSFYSTIKKISEHHQNALDKIIKYEKNRDDALLMDYDKDVPFDEEENEDFESFTIGTKRKITLKEIDESGNLQAFKKDIKTDLNSLDLLQVNLQKFESQIEKEKSEKSADSKLQKLIEVIKRKQLSANKKIVIFTVYKDTAEYLFAQLKKRGFKNLAMVSGTYSLTDNSNEETKKYEPILQRFAPFTKLFKEKEWTKFSSNKESEKEKYVEWLQWLKENNPAEYKKIESPIDILIATDVLSEGQNLQDADMVVNYDIHWNPVRVIQRMGRIDRLGSPNEKIYGINFFPSKDINDYLGLQKRVEDRMISMKLMGSEVDPEFTQSLKNKLDDETLERRQTERMLKQMEISFNDIETMTDNLGFNDLSLETFRQDFLAEIGNRDNSYKNMPNGVYTGFKANENLC